MYVGFCFKPCLSRSSSEQKPSLRQRYRLNVSKAESRISLIVLLTAPKIFAISSITDKKTNRNFARLSAWWFRLGGTPTPETKTYSERTYKRNVQFRRRNTSRRPRACGAVLCRALIQGVLINGMCLFEVSVRKANAEISAELDGCTRMRGTVLRKPPRRRSGITRG